MTSKSFIAEASRTFDASPEEAFDKLADHASWGSWMPRSFRPVPSERRAFGKLGRGDAPRVYIAGSPVPSAIRVAVADRPRELTWTGGLRGVLFAEHRFLFEANGTGGTIVRSVETWSGALASLVRPVVGRVAERVGREQLEGLARGLER